MKLARSSFSYKLRAKSPDQMKVEADLRDRIEAICLQFSRYGYCRVRRRWVKTTDSRRRFPSYPNLIKGMVISWLNQVWLANTAIWFYHRQYGAGIDFLSAAPVSINDQY